VGNSEEGAGPGKKGRKTVADTKKHKKPQKTTRAEAVDQPRHALRVF
jgi:hypothetical protein